MKKKSKSYRSEYEHYQPNNPLTIYFRKLIEKDINNNTNVYPETDGSKPQRLKKRSFKRRKYGLNKRPTSSQKREK